MPNPEPPPAGPAPLLNHLTALARQAAQHWEMQVGAISLVAAEPRLGRAIWRIETDHGPRGLKLLHRPYRRCLFSLAAQEYLLRRGARVPPLVRTAAGELCAQVDGRTFAVTEWIPGLRPAPGSSLTAVTALCRELGRFHRLSQGYQPPPEADCPTRLHRWVPKYHETRSKLQAIAGAIRPHPDTPSAPAIDRVIDRFISQAGAAAARLERSAYGRLAARGEACWGLAHQNYSLNNAQFGPGGVWVIDLDGLCFDLPIRDLRKLISLVMTARPEWSPDWVRAMTGAYSEANPIEPDLMEVLLIDLSFPNEFYARVQKITQKPDREITSLIDHLIAAEESKWRTLHALGLPPFNP